MNIKLFIKAPTILVVLLATILFSCKKENNANTCMVKGTIATMNNTGYGIDTINIPSTAHYIQYNSAGHTFNVTTYYNGNFYDCSLILMGVQTCLNYFDSSIFKAYSFNPMPYGDSEGYEGLLDNGQVVKFIANGIDKNTGKITITYILQ